MQAEDAGATAGVSAVEAEAVEVSKCPGDRGGGHGLPSVIIAMENPHYKIMVYEGCFI